MKDRKAAKTEAFQSNIWFCVLYNGWLVSLKSVVISKIILSIHAVKGMKNIRHEIKKTIIKVPINFKLRRKDIFRFPRFLTHALVLP